MHLALYAPEADKMFAPEPFNDDYRQFIHKRLTDLLERRYNLLIDNYTKITDPVTQKLAWDFMESKELIDEFAKEILTKDIDSQRIRKGVLARKLTEARGAGKVELDPIERQHERMQKCPISSRSTKKAAAP